jgi:hypothetical protein
LAIGTRDAQWLAVRAILLVVLIPPLVPMMACVTTRSLPRQQSARTLESECVRGKPTASIDSSLESELVRLRFERVSTCEVTREIVWATETETRLAQPVRVTLGILGGAVVAAPFLVLFAAVVPANPNPATRQDIGKVVNPVIIAPAALAGFGVWAATGSKVDASTVETVERTTQGRSSMNEWVMTGTIAAAGLEPRPLYGGALELTLDEATSVEQLSLDGEAVELPAALVTQLRALPVCKQALDGFDPESAASEPAIEREARLTRAAECNRHGWAFADRVLGKIRFSRVLP